MKLEGRMAEISIPYLTAEMEWKDDVKAELFAPSLVEETTIVWEQVEEDHLESLEGLVSGFYIFTFHDSTEL